jgi:hypothetical protein
LRDGAVRQAKKQREEKQGRNPMHGQSCTCDCQMSRKQPANKKASLRTGQPL